jgi:hypothetical protein
LARQVEAGALHHLCLTVERVRSKEDRGSEDPLESGNQAAVLLASGMHAEALQHLGGGSKANHLGLLLNGQGGQEDGHEAVLTKRHTEVRMAGDLKEEAAIAPLV